MICYIQTIRGGVFMAKEVVWSKIIMETFFEESGINDRIKRVFTKNV